MEDNIVIKGSKPARSPNGFRIERHPEISIDPKDILAVSFFCAGQDYSNGRTIHMRNGDAIGTIEPLFTVLAKAAEVIGEDRVKKISVIVHDKTPGSWGFPQVRKRFTGDQYSKLEV